MCCTVLCLATLAWGIEVGWQRSPDGHMEYIIQIEPHVLEALRGGEEIVSDIPPGLMGVRSYRIRVGTDEVPREGRLEPEPGGWPPGDGPDMETGPARPGYSSTDLPWAHAPQILPPATDVKPVQDFREKTLGCGRSPDRATAVEGGRSPAPNIEKTAEFVEPQLAEEKPPAADQDTEQPEEAEAAKKPWLPLTAAWLAACGCFGGMLFAGWIACDYRRQYRALLQRMIEGGESGVPPEATCAPETGL